MYASSRSCATPSPAPTRSTSSRCATATRRWDSRRRSRASRSGWKARRRGCSPTARYRSRAHRHQSYAARGAYADQLRRWHAHVPPERLLVVSSEELFADPGRTTATVLEFLGLDTTVPRLPVRNQRPYPPMSDAARSLLTARFDEPNQELYELIGRDLGWSSPRPVAAS